MTFTQARSAEQQQTSDTAKFVVQIGHGAISALAMSPDGRYIATGGVEGAIKVWEVSTGRLFRTLVGHHGMVRVLAFTADGASLFSSGFSDESLRVWRISSGSLLAEAGDVGSASAIQFTPDGAYALVSGSGMHPSVWDVATGEMVRRFEQIDGVAALTANGTRVIGTSDEGNELDPAAPSRRDTLRIWDLRTGKQLQEFPALTGGTMAIEADSDGRVAVRRRLLLTPKTPRGFDSSTELEIVDLARGERVCVLESGKMQGLGSIAVSSDGRYAATAVGMQSIRIHELPSGRLVRTIDGQMPKAAFAHDGRLLVADKAGVQIEDPATGDVTGRVGSAGQHTGGLDFEFRTGRLRWGKHLLELDTGRVSPWLEADGYPVAVSLDGKRVVLWDIDGESLSVYDIGSRERTLSREIGEAYCYPFSPDCRHAVRTLRGADGSLAGGGSEIWDFEADRVVGQSPGLSIGRWFSPTGEYLVVSAYAAGENQWKVSLHEVETGRLIREFESPGDGAIGMSFAMSPDEEYLVAPWQIRGSGGSDGHQTVGVWDVGSGRMLRTFEESGEDPGGLSFSRDGRFVLAVCTDKKARMWEFATGRFIRAFDGEASMISASLSIDGRYVVAAEQGGALRVWEAATGKLLYSTIADEQGEFITWTPDGYYFGSDFAARNFCHIVQGSQTFPIDQFFDRFYNPDMVQARLRGEAVEAPELAQVLASSPPPCVTFVSPARTGTGPLQIKAGDSSGAGLKVVVAAEDTGGGVKEIRLFHNGKRVAEDARGLVGATAGTDSAPAGSVATRTFQVALVQGGNALRASAFSEEMVESLPAELVIHYQEPGTKPVLRILAIGINTYRNTDYNLRLARKDAETFVRELQQQARTMYADVQVCTLYDEQATRQSILAVFDEIAANTAATDVFSFYFAGHGVLMEEDGRFYLSTHGVTRMTSEFGSGSILEEGISDQELSEALQRIPALKQVVFLDACQSAAADLSAMARGATEEVAIKKLSRASGTWIFTAADKQQYALEETAYGHGLFTYALLEGIKGKADGGTGDGIIKLSE
ncbi:MAG: caspase family protein, partial [Candidatus Hydrogenedentes bacterium]|nr:caspase family protein [Candidatus Hydrogenedentota bacterium]